MKNLIIIILMLAALPVMAPIGVAKNMKAKPLYETFTLDAVTVYNPVSSQCDSDPLTTASLAVINKDKLRKGRLRWMALSRDMLKRWGGRIKYGDTVYLSVGDPAIDGRWIVKDTMNKRFKRQGDLLFHESVRTKGKWKNVKIKLIKRAA